MLTIISYTEFILGNNMSKILRRFKKLDDRKQIAQTVKQRLALFIASLIAIIFILLFWVGKVLWPVWLTEYRSSIIGFILFIVIFLILLSPIIIEATSNPRALSGPGKNPKGPRLE